MNKYGISIRFKSHFNFTKNTMKFHIRCQANVDIMLVVSTDRERERTSADDIEDIAKFEDRSIIAFVNQTNAARSAPASTSWHTLSSSIRLLGKTAISRNIYGVDPRGWVPNAACSNHLTLYTCKAKGTVHSAV